MNKAAFLKYQAQTTPHPLAMEISHAEGSYIFDTNNKAYLDFVAGVSACSLGHRHPKVLEAIHTQLEKYMHVMVYGEYIQKPALELTKLLAKYYPKNIEKTYLTNSGTEAIDGALKLARRYTGRSEILAADKAYHGNTMGALSVMGYEVRKQPFRPLIPDVRFLKFNAVEDLKKISSKTAAVILETIQGGAGFVQPKDDYLNKVQKRCSEVGALLILDEIQPGIGRTGTFFAYEQFNLVPDILCFAKGIANGFPLGGILTSNKIASAMTVGSHGTTFGGGPIACAIGSSVVDTISKKSFLQKVTKKEKIFINELDSISKKLGCIQSISSAGLWISVEFNQGINIDNLIALAHTKGLMILKANINTVRFSPSLIIEDDLIKKGLGIFESSILALLKK